MTEEQIALGRRAVACRHWRWVPGMLTHDGYRTAWSDDGMHRSFKLDGSEITGWTEQLVPDLTDAATLGCLLALVREAWRSTTYVRPNSAGWSVILGSGKGMCKISQEVTEVEALIAALKAWP